LAWAGLRNFALDDFEIAAGFGDLHCFHFWHCQFSSISRLKPRSRYPSFLIRLEMASVVCFVGVTSIFNRFGLSIRNALVERLLRAISSWASE
jgi:hypothetical protein